MPSDAVFQQPAKDVIEAQVITPHTQVGPRRTRKAECAASGRCLLKRGQLCVLEAGPASTRHAPPGPLCIWKKLDKKIDIAVGAHLAPGGRSKKRKFPNLVSSAEAGQLGLVNLYISEMEHLTHGYPSLCPELRG